VKDVAIFPLDPVAVDSVPATSCSLAVLHLDHKSQYSTCVCHTACFFYFSDYGVLGLLPKKMDANKGQASILIKSNKT
jgi:hypothetical protein